MDFFKRITNLLTPPPGKLKAPSPSADVEEPAEIPQPINLAHKVKELVRAPSLEHPQATKAIDDLKKAAADIGLYIAASKMRFQLDGMSRTTQDGEVNCKDRGYVLAADLIYQHINREMRAAHSEGRPIGPNIFRGYCNELVNCLLHGKKARRAIELPILIIDDLLYLAMEDAQSRDLYVELAEVTAQATVEQGLAKLDADERERNRLRQGMRRGETPSTPPTDRAAQLDTGAVGYAERILESLTRLRSLLASIQPVSAVPPGADQETRLPYLTYLRAMTNLADQAGYEGFSAALCSRLGASVQSADAALATEALRQSAARFESLAEKERALVFTKLFQRRISRASELYTRLGDVGKAQELKAALGQM